MSEPVPSRRLSGSDAVLGDELVRELLDARLVCLFACLDRSGSIHAVPMWYAAGAGCVLLATGSQSRKVANLRADARATLVLHDSRPGYEVCGATLRGRAEIASGPEARDAVDLVHARYVERRAWSDPDVGPFLDSDDVAVRFVPESALTWDERESTASRRLRELGAAVPLEPTEPRP